MSVCGIIPGRFLIFLSFCMFFYVALYFSMLFYVFVRSYTFIFGKKCCYISQIIFFRFYTVLCYLFYIFFRFPRFSYIFLWFSELL